MTTVTCELYTPTWEETNAVDIATKNRMEYVSKYTGEHGKLLPVGTRVRVRPDVLTTRSQSVRAWYVDTGVIVRICGRTLTNGGTVYEYPYMVLFDDGADLGGYASWELWVQEDGDV